MLPSARLRTGAVSREPDGRAAEIVRVPSGRTAGARKRVTLDAIDRRIVAVLQEHGRITNLDLSRRVGLSPPPCLRRVRALVQAGIIRGFHARIASEVLGWRLTFFAIVELDSQKEEVLSTFERLVAGWPEVRECHMIRGGGDFLLRVVARDIAHENELTEALTRTPSVNRVQTLQTIQTSHCVAGVPVTIEQADRPGAGAPGARSGTQYVGSSGA